MSKMEQEKANLAAEIVYQAIESAVAELTGKQYKPHTAIDIPSNHTSIFSRPGHKEEKHNLHVDPHPKL